ncbi:response regulator [Halarcobacter ebronensis]|uniref:Transcriptional regulator n=1 Tax=Halarcobacter ebronensis TaxID=1462615 RepID=A0A4Q1ALT8_9BACT|nr:response regulator [Halarcobacter ebronensis]QKF81041.1 two-component system response regulator [Halarcobacter ebronensis]RXK06351.1 transcriptional regulator [Halarcobacter ebronensis]
MKKSILIVEDEIVTAMDIKEALEAFRYNVIGIASSIKKALSLLEQNRCDLAILDITLKKGEDGISLSDTISQKYNIPFIFLTANDKNHTIERAIKHEPYGYIIKPFKDAELKAVVELALTKFSAKQKLEKELETNQKHFMALEKNLEESEKRYIKKRFCTLKFGYLFDREENRLFLEKKEIPLNKKEIMLFDILLDNENAIVSSEAIEDYLYNGDLVGEGALRNVLFRLRQKVDKALITRHSGVGYKIEIK